MEITGTFDKLEIPDAGTDRGALRTALLAMRTAGDSERLKKLYLCIAHHDAVLRTPNASAIRTNSASDFAPIFCIKLPRCTFTVISLTPSLPAICLFMRPAV